MPDTSAMAKISTLFASQSDLPITCLPPRPPPEPADGQKKRRGALVIVDYEHDEAAMSPEAEIITMGS